MQHAESSAATAGQERPTVDEIVPVTETTGAARGVVSTGSVTHGGCHGDGGAGERTGSHFDPPIGTAHGTGCLSPPLPAAARERIGDATGADARPVANRYRVCGKPRSTFDVAGSGHLDVTTFVRV